MGFGSYDESEQENEIHGSDIETTEETQKGDHNGEVEFNVGSTDEMLDKLQDIKDDE